jgi:N-acetylmuramoyl-L-alanine amidase
MKWMPSFGDALLVGSAAALIVASPVAAPAQAPSPPDAVPEVATISSVQRQVLPEAVRVTVEMDREVPFYQERLDNPPRLYFDLKGVRTVPELVDASLKYDDEIVHEIRLGRHPNRTVRIVFDVAGVNHYSVFTLYEPYRIVIDFERAGPPTIEKPAPARTAPEPHVPSTDLSSAPAVPAANTGGSFSVARQLGLGVSRIVIDPGHGGHDPGATAFGMSEAELVLDVALKLEALLQQHQVFDVVLTRRTDEFVPLEERTAIANREGADLFLSIHANASANAAARGVETYFLNFALNRQAEAVAARENAASEKTMNSLPQIIKAITLNSKLNESKDFAALVQRSLVRGLRGGNNTVRDLGVRQAPFMVLIGAAMPSILTEISFVTNRTEARLLKTSAHRQKIAESLLAGILKYQQALKKVDAAALQ